MDEDSIVISERRTVYKGFFRIDHFRLRHRLFAGGWSPELSREVFLRHNAAGILLYDPGRDEIVFIEQFRLAAHLAGFAAWQLEIVAGIIDTDESAAAVARREAAEEAGLAVIGEVPAAFTALPTRARISASSSRAALPPWRCSPRARSRTASPCWRCTGSPPIARRCAGGGASRR